MWGPGLCCSGLLRDPHLLLDLLYLAREVKNHLKRGRAPLKNRSLTVNLYELKSAQRIAQCKAPQFSSCPPVATQPAFTSTSTRSVLRRDLNNRITLAANNNCPQEDKPLTSGNGFAFLTLLAPRFGSKRFLSTIDVVFVSFGLTALRFCLLKEAFSPPGFDSTGSSSSQI